MKEWSLKYHPAVLEHDIPRLDAKVRVIIQKSIESKLVVHPEIYGKPLSKNLKGYRSHRVGDWRVLFQIHGSIITILSICHRREAYRRINRRIEDVPENGDED